MFAEADYLPLADDVSQFDRRVYQAIAAYAWDEAECYPSQERVARDVGCARESANRAVQNLIAAGWLRIKARRWRPGARYWHNVYELLADYRVGDLTMKRIIRRCHNTARKRAARLTRRLDHTNTVRSGRGKPGWCGCPHCRPDRARVKRPPPLPVRPPPRSATLAKRVAERLQAKGLDPALAYALLDVSTSAPKRPNPHDDGHSPKAMQS
ncbi:MAG: helix-turn-helix domain-containing protein [Mycobacteriales bacterium]